MTQDLGHIRTFRERRDQYLQTLEKTVKRLRTNEAGLQNEVERLSGELGATKLRLADSEAKLFKLPFDESTHQRNEWGNSSFASTVDVVNAYMTPSDDRSNGEAESFASGTTALVWVESMDEQLLQMHVTRADDVHIGSDGYIRANANSLPLEAPMTSRYDTAYVSQLDVVIVAMEFVLK